jgi:hypothetical protein
MGRGVSRGPSFVRPQGVGSPPNLHVSGMPCCPWKLWATYRLRERREFPIGYASGRLRWIKELVYEERRNTMRPLSIGIGLMMLSGLTANAHHSRAHFDQQKTIEIEGTVTEVSWRSPHVYLQVEAQNAAGVEETWTLEGHSIPGQMRVGWQRDSVQVGDRAVVVAHPNRDPAKRFAMLYSATLEDGSTYYAYSIPDGTTVPGVENRRPAAPSKDFSGIWRAVISLQEATVDSYHAPTDWPLTAAGRTQAEAFDINEDPVLDCVPMGVPRLIISTYSHAWRRNETSIVIEKERTPQIRTIHLDGATRPQDFEPDELGYSVGHFEADGTLVIETDGFAATPWGNHRGLDSSDQKRVVEQYKLTDDGYGMRVSYTIEDPVYLTRPVTVEGEYRKSADFEFVEETCDPETARRHLQFF